MTMSSTQSHLFCIHAGPSLILRHWTQADVLALARHANNRLVWKNLRDEFPSPYLEADAEAWVNSGRSTQLCIDYNGEAVGGVGFNQKTGIERCSAEAGYWLGEEVWGKGLATMALIAMSKWAFEIVPELERLYSLPFADNAASRRVLEKGGYTLDAVLKRAAIKEGKVLDMALYSLLRPH